MNETVTIAFIVLVAVLVSLVGLALVRRMVPASRLAQHTDVAGYVYAVIGVIYAVILAFVVIAAWEEYRAPGRRSPARRAQCSTWPGRRTDGLLVTAPTSSPPLLPTRGRLSMSSGRRWRGATLVRQLIPSRSISSGRR